jgi:hypothetical protein
LQFVLRNFSRTVFVNVLEDLEDVWLKGHCFCLNIKIYINYIYFILQHICCSTNLQKLIDFVFYI